MLHDLGKLGIADAILHKPGALDDGEWKEIMRHPEIGARILEHAGMSDIADWVRAHHERLDGNGYPKGIGGSTRSRSRRGSSRSPTPTRRWSPTGHIVPACPRSPPARS